MDGNVLGLAPSIHYLLMYVIQLYLLMAVDKGLEPLALERHQKTPHWLDYYPLAPCSGGCTSCSHDLEYSIALT